MNKDNFVVVWSGRTEYFDEIVDSLFTAGIKCEVDKQKSTIRVPKERYDEANGILMELNSILEAGW